VQPQKPKDNSKPFIFFPDQRRDAVAADAAAAGEASSADRRAERFEEDIERWDGLA
jgi:hypothetical protein